MVDMNGGYTRNKVEGYNKERYSIDVFAMYQIRLFEKYSLGGNLFYTKYWDSGYDGIDIEKPLQLNLTISRTFTLKNSLRLYTMIKCDDVFGWDKGFSSFVNSESFTQEQYSKNKRTPISIHFQLNFGTFRVKPVKQTMSRGEIGGFVSPKKEGEQGTK